MSLYVMPHYAGPFYLALLILLASAAFWILHAPLSWFPVSLRVGFLLALVLGALSWQINWQHQSIPDEGRTNVPIIRETMRQDLLGAPGLDVVFIRHITMPQIWIYNGANIDDQQVVWAVDMGWEKNRELRQYYPNRRPWIMLTGAKVVLEPYPENEQAYQWLIDQFVKREQATWRSRNP